MIACELITYIGGGVLSAGLVGLFGIGVFSLMDVVGKKFGDMAAFGAMIIALGSAFGIVAFLAGLAL